MRKITFTLILGAQVRLRQFGHGVVYSDGKSATPIPPFVQHAVPTPTIPKIQSHGVFLLRKVAGLIAFRLETGILIPSGFVNLRFRQLRIVCRVFCVGTEGNVDWFALINYAFTNRAIEQISVNQFFAITSFVRQDPLAVLGFMLLGASGILSFRLFMKLEQIGDKSYQRSMFPLSVVLAVSKAYLAHARRKNYSPWPAYLPWVCAAVGWITLIVGLCQL